MAARTVVAKALVNLVEADATRTRSLVPVEALAVAKAVAGAQGKTERSREPYEMVDVASD